MTYRILCLLLITVLMTNTMAKVINVPEDYPTIQDGLDASIEGDTVIVPVSYTHLTLPTKA